MSIDAVVSARTQLWKSLSQQSAALAVAISFSFCVSVFAQGPPVPNADTTGFVDPAKRSRSAQAANEPAPAATIPWEKYRPKPLPEFAPPNVPAGSSAALNAGDVVVQDL